MKSSILKIKGIEIPTILAISELEQQRGLMNCHDLPPSMSFIYKYPKINKFWMHNTPKALDIVFCADGKILSIAKGEPFSTSLIGPEALTNLVVEFPYGTCNNLKISEGDEVYLADLDTPFDKKYY